MTDVSGAAASTSELPPPHVVARVATKSPDALSWRNSPSAEEQVLFLCTRQTFSAGHCEQLFRLCAAQPIDWQAIHTTATAHGVTPLVYHNLLQSAPVPAQIPGDVVALFEQSVKANKLLKGLMQARVREILDFFNARSIDVMFVKGAALNLLVYRQPWYTLSADSDLIVRCLRDRFTKEERTIIWPQPDQPLPPLRRLANVEAEFMQHHDISMNGLLPVDFDSVFERAADVRIDGQPALVMCPEDLLLSACINSCRKRYFRLKALCDIAELIETLPLDWDQVVTRAKEWQCHIIVYAALSATSQTVGCTVPARVFDDLSVSRWRRWLIDGMCRRRSFARLSSLSAGVPVFGHQVGIGLLLPYATYTNSQIVRHAMKAVRDCYRSAVSRLWK